MTNCGIFIQRTSTQQKQQKNKLLICETAQINLQTLCWTKEAEHKIVHIVLFHLYNVLGQANWLRVMKSEQRYPMSGED